jgi:hypothetical protein
LDVLKPTVVLGKWPRAAKDALLQHIKTPCHGAYVHWGFSSPLARLDFDVTISRDPGSTVGEYLALYNGSIDGSAFYMGLQTNVSNPELGRGTGKGLIFSTWWSFDVADARLGEDGFCELGTHEGKFIGVRRPYPWTTGRYRVTLARSVTEVVDGREMDWFDLSIATRPNGDEKLVGGLRFPRRSPGSPASIEPGGLLFFEVYSGASNWDDVAPWYVDVMAYGDGARCPGGRTEYPRYPFGQQMPNVNVRFGSASGLLQVRAGSGVVRTDPPGKWP